MATPFTRSGKVPHAASLRQAAERVAMPFPSLVAEAERIAATVAQGVHGRRQRGIGETFWEYRHHRAEDGASAVDWRMSARTQNLFVRENEWEAANTVWMWRDGSASMDWASSKATPTKRDRAAICLIALASLLTRGGERVAVLGESAAPRSGELGMERVSARLAMGPGSMESVESPRMAKHGQAVIASDFLDPFETWQARLARFSAMQAGGVLLRVIDPAEEDFLFTGRTRFEAPGGGETLLFGRAEEAGQAYRARWARHGDAISDLARRANWTLVTHRTDRPATQAVLALHRALSRDV